jgi:hypothetical protein
VSALQMQNSEFEPQSHKKKVEMKIIK